MDNTKSFTTRTHINETQNDGLALQIECNYDVIIPPNYNYFYKINAKLCNINGIKTLNLGR